MDTPPPPPTITTIKNPEPDDQIQPKQHPPPFTNGVLKRHRNNSPHPVVVTYKECLKNHAASIGGHALDGCGEFMAAPTSVPTDPKSIKCAACGCHRNFHRRDPDQSFLNNPPVQHVIEYQPHHRHHPPPPPPPPPPPQPISFAGVKEFETTESPADSPSPPPISSSYYPSAPHMLLALSSGVTAPPQETVQNHSITFNNSGGKKRFRTKFTQNQKERMHELAERVGWKMQKKDEELIVGFCNEIGVEKGVFKVWMHNNKMTFKKDSGNQHVDSGSSGGGGVDFSIGRNSDGGGNVVGTNGSSSSS